MKVDKFRNLVILHKVFLFSCHHLSNRCLEAGSRILFARFSGVSDRKLFNFFDFLWLCVSFFNVHTKPGIIPTKWCDL